jgi:hypothetical protein
MRTVARLLLAAGAALVVIAVLVFAVAGWARLGPAGRLGILLAATALVLAAPRALAGRGLHATAESVAAIVLALTIVDAVLALRLTPSHPDGPLAYAGVIAVLAVAWRAYGLVGRLSGPRLAAIVLAQLPGPLALTGLVRQIGEPGPRSVRWRSRSCSTRSPAWRSRAGRAWTGPTKRSLRRPRPRPGSAACSRRRPGW